MLSIIKRVVFFYVGMLLIISFIFPATLSLAHSDTLPCPLTNQKQILKKLNKAIGPYKYDLTELNQWFSSQRPYKGVSLLLHGLNNKPSTMNPLALHLSTLGHATLRGSLRGHRGSLKEGQNVTVSQWREDVDLLYCLALLKSQYLKVPLNISCYSMGCLLFLDLFKRIKSLKQDNMVERAIFISPAIKVRPELSWLSHLFKMLPSDWMIPSSNIKLYRSQNGTSVSSYKAFFELLDENHSIDFLGPKSFGLPKILTLLNPKDELVDAKSIIKLFRKMPKEQTWVKLIEIENKNATTIKHINHLLLDEDSLGRLKWQEWKEHISLFLKEGKRATLY